MTPADMVTVGAERRSRVAIVLSCYTHLLAFYLAKYLNSYLITFPLIYLSIFSIKDHSCSL